MEAIEAYWDTATRGSITVSGSPVVWFVIDPAEDVLALRVVADADRPQVDERRRVSVVVFSAAGVRYMEMRLVVKQGLPEAVALLGAVADRIQLNGSSFSDAVQRALAAYGHLLARPDRLSEEQEIGLIAELATLRALMRSGPVSSAVDMWVGTASEEHDFRLPASDLEVKCTRSEHPAHWISSATQMVPSSGRALHLLSVQVTAGTRDIGVTLPRLADLAIDDAGSRGGDVVHHLQPLYQREDEPQYTQAWSLRATPAFYVVDDKFPAITPRRLQNSVPRSELLLEVRYRVDLSGLEPTDPLFPLIGLTLTTEAATQ
ncbi:PD-(D/E)XK motif protein [Jatrophihabitans sp. YIM 134969]